MPKCLCMPPDRLCPSPPAVLRCAAVCCRAAVSARQDGISNVAAGLRAEIAEERRRVRELQDTLALQQQQQHGWAQAQGGAQVQGAEQEAQGAGPPPKRRRRGGQQQEVGGASTACCLVRVGTFAAGASRFSFPWAG